MPEIVRDHPDAFLYLLLVAGVIGWQMWQTHVSPLFIPKVEIDRLADDLIAQFGPRADDVAAGREDHAWHYCHTEEHGTEEHGLWQRVRKELWRRFDAGEWAGPER